MSRVPASVEAVLASVRRVVDRMAPTIEMTRRFVRQVADAQPPVPVTVRCAVCGTVVMRYNPTSQGRNFSRPLASTTPRGDVPCPTHGPLRWESDWRDEWERRGRPDRLNLKLPPEC